MGIEKGYGAIGENKTKIKPDKRAAATKNKTHKSADAFVFFDPITIVNPNQREVLYVVKDFEEGDPDEKIGDAVIAIPPKADAGNQERELDWIRSLGLGEHPGEIRDECDRDSGRKEKQTALQHLQDP